MVLDMLLFSLALVGMVFVLAYMWDLWTTSAKKGLPITQFLFILALFLFSLKGVFMYLISALNVPAFDLLYAILDIISLLSIIIAFGMYMWKGKKPGLDEEEE